MYLGWNSCEVFEVAADSVGFFDNGVHAQLGDLVNECVLIAFPVLHHCGQQRENNSDCVLGKYFPRYRQTSVLNWNMLLCDGRTVTKIIQALREFYQGPSCACTRWCSRWSLWRPAEPSSAEAGRGGSPAWPPAAPSAAAGNASPAAPAWLRKSRGWCNLFSPWKCKRADRL